MGALSNVCAHASRQDRIDSDAPPGQLDGCHLGEGHLAGLGGGVARVPGKPEEARTINRRVVTMIEPPPAARSGGMLCFTVRKVPVRLVLIVAFPLVQGHLLDRTLHAIDAGVGEHDVKSTKRLDRLCDGLANLLLITYVGNGCHRPATVGLNMIGHCFRRLVTDIYHGNRCSGAGKRVARALANARPTASDQSDFICELCIHRPVTLPDRGLPAPAAGAGERKRKPR